MNWPGDLLLREQRRSLADGQCPMGPDRNDRGVTVLVPAVVRRDVRRVRGLTLIETAVVVTVISIVFAIIGAALLRAQAKARQVTCVSNLRAIAQATRLYALDYDGTPPFLTTVISGLHSELGPTALIRSLAVYGATPEVWHCPADPDYGKSNIFRDHVEHSVTSYVYPGWNNYVGVAGGPDGYCEPPDIIGMNQTARERWYVVAGDARHTRDPVHWDVDMDSAIGLGSWHFGGWNVAYIDGSVKWLPMMEVGAEPPSPFVIHQEAEVGR
jgi:type II secretory pathway pseudopilin PulG